LLQINLTALDIGQRVIGLRYIGGGQMRHDEWL